METSFSWYDTPKSTEGITSDSAKTLISMTEIVINHNKQKIEATQKARKDRLGEGCNQEMVSHFTEMITQLLNQNDMLITACNSVKKTPNDESIKNLYDALP